MKKLNKLVVLAAMIIATFGVLIAQISVHACPPFLGYQPQLPKSLV